MFTNNNFYGKIDNIKVDDCIKKLNYSLKDVTERVDLCYSLLGINDKTTQKADRIWTSIFEGRDEIVLSSSKNAKYYISYEKEPLNFEEFMEWCKYNDYNPVDFLEEYDYEHRSSWKIKEGHSGIKVNLNASDSLYSESNVAKTLECLASYILAVDKKNNEEPKEKLYNSKELFNRRCKEEALLNNIGKSNTDSNNEFAIFEVVKNYKKAPNISVSHSDLKKYPILSLYQNAYDLGVLKFKSLSVANGLSDNEKRIKYILRKDLGRLKQDMVDTKLAIERPIKWKQPLKDNGSPNWDYLDLMDREHVKYLLQVNGGEDLQEDKNCIVYDLKRIISMTDFTKKQESVLELWRRDYPISGDKGKGSKGIAEILNMSQPNVTKILNQAIDKICKTYEEQLEDWYYLNVVKGTYKRCSKCGEIKLIQKFNKNGSKGYMSMCKKCRRR